VLARAGLGSRRSVEELVVEGRVRINGKLAELGNRVVASRDQITVDDVPVPADPQLVYLAVNKPRGVTTTLRDKHAARTVAELVPPGSPRLVPVGRLDRESEGLLLMTNDGDLAHRLQHPRFGVQKEYLVEVPGDVPPNVVRRLVEGIELDDGVARAIRARISAKGKRRSAVTLVMGEGRKREIRRMFSALGLHVDRLVRVRFGPVRLGRLGPGEVRPLDVEEVRDLYKVTELRRARRG
jgi:23S rRNA pseudouridine2605 synthase